MHNFRKISFGCGLLMLMLLWGCNGNVEHMAPAIGENDSVATMTSYGVNTLISDSGVMKYRIVSERWEVHERTNPPKWQFLKGIFLQQYDKEFHTACTIVADTAWYYNVDQLWELRGRVCVRNNEGTVFNSEELFWSQRDHELYSHKFARLYTPERQLEGTEFRSNEQMTRYNISNSKGAFPTEDVSNEEPAPPPSPDAANDSSVNVVPAKPHPQPVARPKRFIPESEQQMIDKAKESVLDSRRKMEETK